MDGCSSSAENNVARSSSTHSLEHEDECLSSPKNNRHVGRRNGAGQWDQKKSSLDEVPSSTTPPNSEDEYLESTLPKSTNMHAHASVRTAARHADDGLSLLQLTNYVGIIIFRSSTMKRW